MSLSKKALLEFIPATLAEIELHFKIKVYNSENEEYEINQTRQVGLSFMLRELVESHIIKFNGTYYER